MKKATNDSKYEWIMNNHQELLELVKYYAAISINNVRQKAMICINLGSNYSAL
jgi:hypothetical protein